MGRIQKYGSVCCAVNPTVAREVTYGIDEARRKKKVLVVGGGVAGCEAARVCAIRGHAVTLWEKTDRLGGNLIPGGVPDFKEDDHQLVRWYELQLRELGAEVCLNTEATAKAVEAFGADAVIVATGSNPVVLNLGDPALVSTAADILLGRKPAGQNVLVIGGGLVGCELALWLKKLDPSREVTVVEAMPDLLMVGTPTCDANTDMLKALLPFHGVKLQCGTRIARTEADGAVLRASDGTEWKVAADTIALAIGYRSNNALFREIQDMDAELYQIGDAGKVANIHYAIWDAYEVARGI